MFWLTPGCLFPSLCALVNNYLADGIMSDNESIHLIPHPVNQKSGHEVPPAYAHISAHAHTRTHTYTQPRPRPWQTSPSLCYRVPSFYPSARRSACVCAGAAQDVCCQQT